MLVIALVGGGTGYGTQGSTFLSEYFISLKKSKYGASLVAQWLGIRLPMQGTRVRAPVWEDPTCRAAASPVSHNY